MIQLFFFVFPPLPSFLVAGGSSAATIACDHVSLAFPNHYNRPYLIENILELVLCQGRALDVLNGAKLSCHPLSVFPLDRRHPLFRQLVLDSIVFSQIDLCTNNQAWHARAVVVNFREPLLAYVFERCGRCDGEADEENVCLGV